MGAGVLDQADSARGRAERNQLFAQELDAHGGAVGRWELIGADGREPVLAHEVAHGCTRADATKDFVVFQAKHLETSRA